MAYPSLQDYHTPETNRFGNGHRGRKRVGSDGTLTLFCTATIFCLPPHTAINDKPLLSSGRKRAVSEGTASMF